MEVSDVGRATNCYCSPYKWEDGFSLFSVESNRRTLGLGTNRVENVLHRRLSQYFEKAVPHHLPSLSVPYQPHTPLLGRRGVWGW